MARDKQYVDGKIVGSRGQILNIGAQDKEFANNQYFAAVVMCGHAGKGFFVPIMFPIFAKDSNLAIEIIKAIPRVKNKNPKCVLGITKISLAEYDFLQAINDKDSYLTSTIAPSDTRKILLPRYADAIMKRRRGDKLSNEEKYEFNLISNKNILYAEDYPDFCVLQKAFAPSRVGDKIVYPNKVNMDELLYEYFKNRIQVLGIEHGNFKTLKYCLQVFGLENEFGIRLDTKNNLITYTDKDGICQNLQIAEETKEAIINNQELRLRNAIKKLQDPFNLEVPPEIEAKIKPPSAIDRFNKKWSKTSAFQPTDNSPKID